VRALKGVLNRYDSFDQNRMHGTAKELEEMIDAAVRRWETEHGEAG
jgi:hypothetical protein